MAGFFRNRFDGFVGGASDIGVSTARFGKEIIGTEESKGTPGIFGMIGETFNAVKNTFVGERGLFTGSMSMTADDGLFNPFDRARRLVAGISATQTTLVGGAIGILSSKVGNWYRDALTGLDQMVTAPFIGNSKKYFEIHRNTDITNTGPTVNRSTIGF